MEDSSRKNDKEKDIDKILCSIKERKFDTEKIKKDLGIDITGQAYYSQESATIEFEGKEPKVYTDKKVTIFSDHREIMRDGEPIHLTSLLEGFEDCIEIAYQWECDKGDGFEPVENGTGDSYTYEASLESMAWSWQLVVYYK